MLEVQALQTEGISISFPFFMLILCTFLPIFIIGDVVFYFFGKQLNQIQSRREIEYYPVLFNSYNNGGGQVSIRSKEKKEVNIQLG